MAEIELDDWLDRFFAEATEQGFKCSRCFAASYSFQFPTDPEAAARKVAGIPFSVRGVLEDN